MDFVAGWKGIDQIVSNRLVSIFTLIESDNKNNYGWKPDPSGYGWNEDGQLLIAELHFGNGMTEIDDRTFEIEFLIFFQVLNMVGSMLAILRKLKWAERSEASNALKQLIFHFN